MTALKYKKYLYVTGLFLTFFLGSIFTNFIIQIFAHGGDTSLIHACVRNNLPNLPNIRIVGTNTNCGSNETALDWNIQGPPGPPGNTGDLPFICTHCDFGFVGSGKHPLLEAVDFENAILYYTSFDQNDMNNENFTNAKLGNSFFGTTNLINVNFTGADMRYSNFDSANLQNVNFSNANLKAAFSMDLATFINVIWSNTICPDGTNSNNNGNTCEGHLTP